MLSLKHSACNCFFLVKPDVETGIRLLKTIYIKIVYQDFRQDGTEQMVWFHATKITLYWISGFFRWAEDES